MRYVAGQPVEQIFPGALAHLGSGLPPGAALPNSNTLRVMVWNIFKQQRADWLSVLQGFGKDAQLVLLQEAQTTPELIRFPRPIIWRPIRFLLICCLNTP